MSFARSPGDEACTNFWPSDKAKAAGVHLRVMIDWGTFAVDLQELSKANVRTDGRCGECPGCLAEGSSCACDGALDDGCWRCSPEVHPRPACPHAEYPDVDVDQST